MKRHLLRLSMIAALAASASFAETYNFSVPFDFVVRNQTAPAGQYLVDTSTASGIMIIRSGDHKMNVVVMGNNLSSQGDGQTGKLVFHRYGNRYFLAEIRTRSGAGSQLPQNSEEKELRAQKIRPASHVVALR
jgi:hypothetical protein